VQFSAKIQRQQSLLWGGGAVLDPQLSSLIFFTVSFFLLKILHRDQRENHFFPDVTFIYLPSVSHLAALHNILRTAAFLRRYYN
jgi:hypothetical protein